MGSTPPPPFEKSLHFEFFLGPLPLLLSSLVETTVFLAFSQFHNSRNTRKPLWFPCRVGPSIHHSFRLPRQSKYKSGNPSCPQPILNLYSVYAKLLNCCAVFIAQQFCYIQFIPMLMKRGNSCRQLLAKK